MWRLRETGDAVDVIIITPEPGMQKEIGQKLLALADHPRDVQWVTYPETGFQIPLTLFAKFDATDMAETLWQMPLEQLEKLAGEQEAPKRRRGRPRKEESTDNNIPEEE